LFFFLSIDWALDEDLARPEEPEGDFCTFAMARMLAEGCAAVNGSQKRTEVSGWIVFTERQHERK
jgi:hypothetical protein